MLKYEYNPVNNYSKTQSCEGGISMTKRNLFFFIIFSIVLCAALAFSYFFIRFQTGQSSTNIYTLKEYIINGQRDDFSHRNLDYTSSKNYVVTSTFTVQDVAEISGNLELVIPKLSANWYQVRLNNVLLGEIGNIETARSSIWNSVQNFTIDKQTLLPTNTIEITAYSEYKFGKSFLPIYITTTEKSRVLYGFYKFLFTDFNYLMIALLFILSLYITLISFPIPELRNQFLLVPFGIMLGSIYFFDFIPIYNIAVPLVVFRKILFFFLYLSTACISFGLSTHYNKKSLKLFSGLMMLAILVAIVFSPDLITFKKFYVWINLSLLLNIGGWFYFAIKSIREFGNESILIAYASAITFCFGLYDALILILGIDPLIRLTVYGILLCCTGFLFIFYTNYSIYQNNLLKQTVLLEQEKDRLKKVLSFDDLTGLYNHRSFHEKFDELVQSGNRKFFILLIDIDQFSSINEKYGHSTGDQIIQLISEIIKRCFPNTHNLFRYGGDKFALIVHHHEPSVAFEASELLRNQMIENHELHQYSAFLPITISVGISQYLVDSADKWTLLGFAEKAVQYAKFTGGNRSFVYHKELVLLMENQDQQIKVELLRGFVYSFASAIDLKDSYTGKHSEEVCRLSLMIAEKLGLGDDDKHNLMFGGTLHDIGKLGIPDSIIQKQGSLTEVEYSTIKNHSKYGFDMAKQFLDNASILSCIRSHHERFDGRGYPDGLKDLEIPLLARIVSVADAFHAMVSDRPYRKGLSDEYALAELDKNKGTQFDPEIVDAFRRCFNN